VRVCSTVLTACGAAAEPAIVCRYGFQGEHGRRGAWLNPGSDRFVLKAILGYAFPVPGKSASVNAPLGMGTSARSSNVLLTK
jgi:hypothetical protein